MTIRTLTLLATTAAALSAQPQTAGFRGMPYEVMDRKVFNAQVKSAPYSAQEVTESTQTLADGTHIKNTVSSQVYRDMEGRTRVERTFNRPATTASGGATLAKSISIVDPVAGAQFQLDPQAKSGSKMTFHAHPGGPGPQARQKAGPRPEFKAKATSNRVVEDLGHQSFEGIDAVGSRVTTTIPAGTLGNEAAIQIVSERWYSADLHLTVMSRNSDPRVGETVYKLSSISRANPDPTLFQVPADFQVSERNGGPGGPGGLKPRHQIQ